MLDPQDQLDRQEYLEFGIKFSWKHIFIAGSIIGSL